MRPGGDGAVLHGLRVQLRVVGALTLRERGTRFGRDNLGYVWLFLEPALLGGPSAWCTTCRATPCRAASIPRASG